MGDEINDKYTPTQVSVERGIWAVIGWFCGGVDYSTRKAPNDPQISAIVSHDIRLSRKYTCILMTS